MATLSGGCLCGAVRYECSEEIAMSALCFCRDCQHTTGGAFSAGFLVPKGSFKLLKGKLTAYETIADNGNKVVRNFCPTCGSPIMVGLSGFPDLVEVAAGSLDDASRYKPAISIFTSSAAPWAKVPSDIPGHAKMPE